MNVMPLLAVNYLRYSSDNQREESIFAQRRAIDEYAAKNDIRIIKEYIDEAESAKNDDRPNFLKMVDDVVGGLIKPEFILVHKLNRFARNRYDAAMYRRKFKNHGAKLVSVTQPIDDSPEGVILEAMLEAMAEYQSLDLGREAFKGLKENALQGIHTGGTPPLGYDVEIKTKKYLLNESEAMTVKLIFDMARQGTSYTKIMEECNRRGYRTKRKRMFGKNSIHDILRNDKYYGALVFHKRAGNDNSHVFRPKEEWIVTEDALPVIIPKEEWDEVQAMMDKRKFEVSPKPKGDTMYLLTGKMVCGECGMAYVGNKSHVKEGREPYYNYTCSGKKRLKNCKNKDWRKEYIENYILDDIERGFNGYTEPKIVALADSIIKKQEKIIKEEGKELVFIKKEIQRLSGQIDRFLNAFAEGKMPVVIAGPKLEVLGKEKSNLEMRLIDIEIKTPLITKEQIIKHMKNNQRIVVERNNPVKCQKVIQEYVKKIMIYSGRIEPEYKFDIYGYNGSPRGSITVSVTVSREELYSK